MILFNTAPLMAMARIQLLKVRDMPLLWTEELYDESRQALLCPACNETALPEENTVEAMIDGEWHFTGGRPVCPPCAKANRVASWSISMKEAVEGNSEEILKKIAKQYAEFFPKNHPFTGESKEK